MTTTSTIPIVMTTAGAQPQSPASLQTQLLADVAAVVPGYSAALPGSLVEDISSTDVYAIALCDSAWVELINSVTPYGANPFILNQLGNQAGITQGGAYNTAVYVVFTGPVGFVIQQGFIVSDGTYQYAVQETSIVGSAGVTGSVYCLAQLQGSWAIPIGTVTNLITSVPNGIILTVTNPTAGTAGSTSEPIPSYQARVLQAGQASAQGMPPTLRTNLQDVPGVQSRLVSIRQQTNQWEIIVGGGDPYQVANAIFNSLFDISDLIGSTLSVTAITNANPGVVTTNLNHGYTTGQIAQINGIVGMTVLNGVPFTVTVLTPTTFSIGINTTSYTAYSSGGVVTPNLRNEVVSINDYPDTYTVPFVIPPSQTVGITVTWNTLSSNYISPAAIAQYAQPALLAYVNSLNVGLPLNLFEMQQTFQDAVTPVLSSQLLTRLVFAVTVNGISVSPTTGTGIIPSDPESYFVTSTANINIVQG